MLRILAVAALLVAFGLLLALLRPSPISGYETVAYTVSFDAVAGGLGD